LILILLEGLFLELKEQGKKKGPTYHLIRQQRSETRDSCWAISESNPFVLQIGFSQASEPFGHPWIWADLHHDPTGVHHPSLLERIFPQILKLIIIIVWLKICDIDSARNPVLSV